MKGKKIGEIIIEEKPYWFKGHKYVAYIRSDAPLPIDELEEAINLSDSQSINLEVMEEIKEVDSLSDEIMFEVAKKYDLERGQGPTEWHRYVVYLRVYEKEDPEDIQEQIDHMLDTEYGSTPMRWVDIKKIRYLPCERPKVKKVPITEEMINQAIERKKKKQDSV